MDVSDSERLKVHDATIQLRMKVQCTMIVCAVYRLQGKIRALDRGSNTSLQTEGKVSEIFLFWHIFFESSGLWISTWDGLEVTMVPLHLYQVPSAAQQLHQVWLCAHKPAQSTTPTVGTAAHGPHMNESGHKGFAALPLPCANPYSHHSHTAT